jgi:hypothetical protein
MMQFFKNKLELINKKGKATDFKIKSKEVLEVESKRI